MGPDTLASCFAKSSGVGGEVPVTTSTANAGYPQDLVARWAARYLLYTTSTPETRNDIWVLPLQPDGKAAPAAQPSPYVTSAADKGDPDSLRNRILVGLPIIRMRAGETRFICKLFPCLAESGRFPGLAAGLRNGTGWP